MKNYCPHPIALAARGWVGTRFTHQGRMKKTETHKGGVDCLGLLVGVAEELELRVLSAEFGEVPLSRFDSRDYGHNPECYRLRDVLAAVMEVVPFSEMQPGDIVLMRLETMPQHVGIISDYAGGGLGLIHAYAAARKVVEHRLDEVWRERIVGVYRVRCHPWD